MQEKWGSDTPRLSDVAVCSSDISKEADPDDIHPQVVSQLADFLAEHLSRLSADSQPTAVVPSDWHLVII